MSIRTRFPLLGQASHSAISLVSGFVAGLTVFLLLGARLNDAVFSALVLAAVVAGSRTLLVTN